MFSFRHNKSKNKFTHQLATAIICIESIVFIAIFSLFCFLDKTSNVLSGFTFTIEIILFLILIFLGVGICAFFLISQLTSSLFIITGNSEKERTKKLSDNLHELTKLKFQQDGDYFLTAQLLKPLGGNHAKSETLSIEYYVQQKKQFLFKKWNEEIGGDLCITQSIHLGGKVYTFVLNADAMGKSIQGAGGILVLGSIINANIDRTKKSSIIQKQSPERWLKNCFIDLQYLFEAFEDMMYVSVIISLIEDYTGSMYYINADHPQMVLYRNQNAGFINDNYSLTKLGMVSKNSKLHVKCMQLKSGDVIYVGSDGRDDIKTGEDQNGNYIMNEDDTLFVNYIQENHANLAEVLNSIKESGELIDDISLIRIEYKNCIDDPLNKEILHVILESEKKKKENKTLEALEIINAALSTYSQNRFLIRKKAKLLYLLNEFNNSSQLAKEYFNDQSYDTNFMNFLSLTLEKSGAKKEAIEIRERLRMRRPKNRGNLESLSSLYEDIGIQSRATVLREEADNLFGNNK